MTDDVSAVTRLSEYPLKSKPAVSTQINNEIIIAEKTNKLLYIYIYDIQKVYIYIYTTILY